MLTNTEDLRQEAINEIRTLVGETLIDEDINKEEFQLAETDDEAEVEGKKVEEDIEIELETATEEELLAGKELKELEKNEESLLNLERQLSGHTKEFKDLVKSIEDPELQKKAIEAGKISRAREDRFASELGEIKKQYEGVANFKKMLETNPKNTILQIAKMANLDLKELIMPSNEHEIDLDEMTTIESKLNSNIRSIEKKNEILANKLEAFELAQAKEIHQSIDNEIESFVQNKKDYPYFEELQESMSDLLTIEKIKNGIPRTSQERISRLEKAYKKALLIDDKYSQKREDDLMRKFEIERREKVEKAKSQKKVSFNSASAPTKSATIREELIQEFKKMGL